MLLEWNLRECAGVATLCILDSISECETFGHILQQILAFVESPINVIIVAIRQCKLNMTYNSRTWHQKYNQTVCWGFNMQYSEKQNICFGLFQKYSDIDAFTFVEDYLNCRDRYIYGSFAMDIFEHLFTSSIYQDTDLSPFISSPETRYFRSG